MLIHHIILLLLSWPCVRAIEDEKPPPGDAIDQVATASENQRVPFEESKNSAPVAESLESSTTLSPINVATIHYENSNGFVPMSSIPDGAASTKTLDVETSREDDQSEVVGEESQDSGKIEDDPAYSTEARMFLNLAGPNADRRSFDTREGQSEFEILKVTNETPAIANYHEFYENMQNNLARNRGGTQVGYGDESGAGATTSQNKKTKDRIQHIDKYLTNYQTNEDQLNYQPVEQFYNNYPSGKPRSVTRQKDIFEPAKVQSFAEHSDVSNYNMYNEAASQRQKTSSQAKSSSHDNSAASSRSNYPAITQKNRYSKPVIVVEPSDYKLDIKYGTQQVSAKSSSVDSHRNQKHRKASSGMELTSQYDEESRVNREDRYGPSYERSEDLGDYSGEEEYMEVTEKPRRIHKSRRRPYGTENSRRLPKEHRSHAHDDQESKDPRKNNSPTRSKLHRPRAKPSYWIEDDRGPSSEENSEEVISKPNATLRPEEKKAKQSSKSKGGPTWSQVAPNIEVSHSNGFEIGQLDKPKLLVPVNLNLLPLGNFDHSAAIDNSQGFDFTNVPNFVTATPLVSSQAPIVSTSHSVTNNGHGNPPNPPKNNQNSGNNNYGLSTPAPDIIVGQNTYHNPVQAVLLPQMNVNNKFPSNLRPHYSASTAAPMFTVTHALNNNLHNVAPTMASIPLQGYHSTVSPRPANQLNQHMQHFTVNPSTPQLLLPQPTLQSFPLMHAHYNGASNYNILVNPNGLHGQNVIQHGNSPTGSEQNAPSSTTTPQPNVISNNNYHAAETQVRKNVVGNANGQYLTTASFSVANDVHQGPSSTANEHKYYLPTNNNINHFHNGNQNNQQQSAVRVNNNQHQENLYQIYRGDQNANGKVKTYIQAAQVVPTFIHHANAVPINLNNQHLTSFGGQLQEQQSVLAPNVVVHTPRNQNQQILNAANDIFENTWKQLQQLRSNEDAARQLPFQHVYRVNDNLGSTSNANGNTINALPGANVNSANAHLPIMANQNVEIINPNIKPSPVDTSMINPYETYNHYPAAVLTTPIPIFSTTANFLVPRPIVASTTPTPIHLQNYVDQLTHLGNQVNQAEASRPVSNHENQRPVFNPINFVPNSDLMKSQSMLNSKNTEPLPNQLNLVPVIPGGNFYKNSPGAQTELVQKPRLSSDLEKYAEEMFKESLRTIYSTHKWNTDRRLRGNYSAAELNELAKLKSELQRYKASMSDPKYGAKDILEAHHSETNIRTAESSGRPTKKPELSMADIEQLFKSDFKLSLPSSGDSSHRGTHSKNRPGLGHGSSRPGTSNEQSNEFRNVKQLSDYLTPPKVNSFLSKSPFIDSPKPGKKRPGSHPRFNSPNGNNRHLPRPSSLVSRPSNNPDVSPSNHVESGVKADGHHRYEKYRSYPTFTTTSSSDSDVFKPSSTEQFSKNDYYDINHPRMHNLLGLLMKNKQLPNGSSQSIFRNEDELRQYFEDDRRRVHTDFFNGSPMDMQKKSDVPINMGPPAPPHLAQVRPYPTRIV